MWMFPDHLHHEGLALYLFYFSVFCVFLVHFFIDLRHQILPDSLNLYLAMLFLCYGIFYLSWKQWLLGGIVGLSMPLLVTWLFYLAKGKVGLGGGDIKLYGALGIFLGPMGVLQTIFLSCLLGSVVGLVLILSKRIDRNHPIAFGPFIIIVSFVQIFFPQAIEWLALQFPLFVAF